MTMNVDNNLQREAILEQQSVVKLIELNDQVHTMAAKELPFEDESLFEVCNEREILVLQNIKTIAEDQIRRIYLQAWGYTPTSTIPEVLLHTSLEAALEVGAKSIAFVSGVYFEQVKLCAQLEQEGRFEESKVIKESLAKSGIVIGLLQIIDHIMDRNVLKSSPDIMSFAIRDYLRMNPNLKAIIPPDELRSYDLRAKDYKQLDRSRNNGDYRFCINIIDLMFKQIAELSPDKDDVDIITHEIASALRDEFRAYQLSKYFFQMQSIGIELSDEDWDLIVELGVKNVALTPAAMMVFPASAINNPHYIPIKYFFHHENNALMRGLLLNELFIRILDDIGDINDDANFKYMNWINQIQERGLRNAIFRFMKKHKIDLPEVEGVQITFEDLERAFEIAGNNEGEVIRIFRSIAAAIRNQANPLWLQVDRLSELFAKLAARIGIGGVVNARGDRNISGLAAAV